MRRLAWVLVVVGVCIATAYPFYASRESDRLVDRWYNESVGSNDLAQVQATAALAGFGVLILAIRRPQ